MTTRLGRSLVLLVAMLVLASGTVSASPGGNPPPTANPDGLTVSLTDGDGTANATYRVNSTTGTVNASYAGAKPDVNVSYTESARAIQFALDNATSENDTVVLGGGTFDGNVTVDQQSGVTIAGGNSRLQNSAGYRVNGIEIRVSNVTIRNLVLANHAGGTSGGKGIYNYDDGLTLRNVRLANNGAEGLRSLGTTTAINVTAVDNDENGLEVSGGPGSELRDITVKRNSNGLKLYSSSNTRVTDARIENNDGNGIETNFNQNGLTYTNVTSTGNGDYGAELVQGATVTDSTFANNGRSGVKLGGKDATLRDVVARDNAHAGVDVTTIAGGTYGIATNATLRNVSVTNNRRGVYAVPATGPNLTLRGVTATDNDDIGIDVTPQESTRVIDTVTSGNGDVDLNVSAATSSLQPTVGSLSGTNVTIGETTFERFEMRNVSVEGNVTPPAPAGEVETVRAIGNVTRLDSGAYADVTVAYATSGALGLNESGFDVGRYDDAADSYETATSSADASENTVTANITSTGPAVILGRPASGEAGVVIDGTSTGTLDIGGTDIADARVGYTTARSGTVTVQDLSSNPSSVPNATSDDGVRRVASYVEITAPEPAAGSNATVELTVDRDRLSNPDETHVWRYANGYERLATNVQSVTESTVRLSFDTPGFSVFVIGEPVAEPSGDESAPSVDDDSGGVGRNILVTERSVTQSLYGGTARQATVEFEQPITGAVTIESADGLPSDASVSDGRRIAAVEITVPDEASGRAATVEITVPRTAVETAGVEPEALHVVRFGEAGDRQRLDTDVVASDDETFVVAAETEGFSTFAVIAPTQTERQTTQPAATTTATVTPEPTATPTPEPATTAMEPTATQEPTDGSGSGFGAVVALVALLATVAAMRRG
ncbi:right-handed parallel beta-helix repeat-containing protein [Haloplanus sp. C73]|uniref:right-handed parallel beta-helix repeat-containing protein n=1 Tax=Haloplanus sp. C73 TaxID=3421641 RepID=UPI003EBAC53D